MDSSINGSEKETMVDSFLVEALRNPRHRLTILRMELDVQRFLHSPDQQQFEFPHYPTSYLRLAAHRVAQHYGLQTVVQDNGLDSLGSRILAWKTTESQYPSICLSEIPTKQSEDNKIENIKLVIRPRPTRSSENESDGKKCKQSTIRTMEERKEEYDRARDRIFSISSSPDSDGIISMIKDENEKSENSMIEPEKELSIGDACNSSRVAIFRDREKDRTDPDYDRSYQRYIRNIPTNQSFSLAPFNMENNQFPYVHYDTGVSHYGQMPSPGMDPFSGVGLTPTYSNAAYIQWPSASMMYAHSYEPFRRAVFQVPFCQQPLSFGYSENQ